MGLTSVYYRQEELVERLKIECSEKFDVDNPQHQRLLEELWSVAFPDTTLPGLKGPHWKSMGWQGDSPTTDLRTAGHLSVRQLVSFGTQQPAAFARLLNKLDGVRSDWEYPFAVAGVTFMLVDALGILPVALGRSKSEKFAPCAPFVRLYESDRKAFDVLFMSCLERLDREWLEAKASYMQFNEMLAKTRTAVERALNERPEPQSVEELRRRLIDS